jgi:RimJ/RimL family protein N-acetyltransferase
MSPMLQGKDVTLRPVQAADVDRLYQAHIAIGARGAYFPLGIKSESAFKSAFAENGFWERTEGMLVIQSGDGEISGHIEFFRPIAYWDAFELSYQLYDAKYAGRGYATEAVQLLTDYLFATKKENRIQLVIAPGNAASRRIAEKCGYSLEGTARGAFWNDGRSQDVLLYGIVRSDPRPWHTETAGS